jgi:hypothetical protein
LTIVNKTELEANSRASKSKLRQWRDLLLTTCWSPTSCFPLFLTSVLTVAVSSRQITGHSF